MSDVGCVVENGVGVVTIDRPPVNALTLQSYLTILDIFSRLGADATVRCIVLTASGHRAFSAGFDFRAFRSRAAAEDDPTRPDVMRRMFETIKNCPLPTIGAINGPAIGSGCVLAATCDIRIAADKATFGLPEIDFGRVGGAAYLDRLVPSGTLRRMAFTGSPITADDAKRIGMVDEVVAPDELENASLQLAGRIAQKPRAALVSMKTALNQIEDLTAAEGYRVEQEISARLRLLLEGVQP